MQIQAPKGMKDVTPKESYKWQYIEKLMRSACAEFGYRETRTPVLEHTELFARGGVSVLNALGCVDTLAFGCETAESEKLLKTADAVCDIRVHDLIKKELEGGINYAAARENAVLKFYGDEISSVLTKPNNILAVEYIKAMKRLGSDMDIYPVFRKGAGHDVLKENGEFASASALSILMVRGDTAYRSFMPSATAEEFL